MNDFNKKNSNTPVILVIVLALVLGIAGYMFYKNKNAETSAVTPTDVTATSPETTAPVTAETETPPPADAPQVVVETKKLDIAPAEAPLPSASSSDPEIVRMMAQRSIGQATAPVKITEYASLTCSHCGAFHRENYEQFKTQFIDTGRVQLTFKEFPLNQPALEASQILRCMPEDKYVSFMNLLFQEQDKWAFDANYKDALRQNAKLAGMSDETFDSCLANTALKEAILGDMKAASDKYQVTSTPSFVVNGGRVLVGNQPISAFEEAITTASSSAPQIQEPVTSSPGTAPAANPGEQESAMESAADAAVQSSGAAPDTETEAPPAE